MQKIIIISCCSLLLSSCFLTKAITTPARVVGAVASSITVVGETIDDSIEVGADAIDLIPL